MLGIPKAAERVGWVLRLALLVLVSLLVVATTKDATSLVWVVLLAIAARAVLVAAPAPVLAPLGAWPRSWSPARREHAGRAPLRAPASALLPYLTVPVILPALAGRLRESLALLAVAAGLLTVAGLYDGVLGVRTTCCRFWSGSPSPACRPRSCTRCSGASARPWTRRNRTRRRPGC